MADPVTPSGPQKKGNGIRWTLLVFNWVVIALVAAQVLFIGLGLLYNSATFRDAHIGAGWMLGHVGALMLIVGFILSFWGRIGTALVTLVGINALLLTLMPFLAGMRHPDFMGGTTGMLISGLHPIAALTMFAISFYLAMKLRALIATSGQTPTAQGLRMAPQIAATPGSTQAPAVVGRVAPPLER